MTTGLLIALLSAASYGGMSFLVSYASGNFTATELVFVRSVFATLVLLPLVWREVPVLFRRESLSLWVRAITGTCGVIFYFLSLQGTTAANANLLFASSPVFVGAIAWLLFRTTLAREEIFGITLILAGNALIYVPNNSPIPLDVGLMGTAGAFFAALAFLSIGEAVKRFSPSLVVFSFSVLSLLICPLIPGRSWAAPADSQGWLFLGSVAVLGLLSQFTSTLSFKYLKSSVATAIGRSSIVFAGVLDIAVAGFRPGAWELASYTLVFLGIFLTHQMRRKLPAGPGI